MESKRGGGLFNRHGMQTSEKRRPIKKKIREEKLDESEDGAAPIRKRETAGKGRRRKNGKQRESLVAVMIAC